MQIKIRHSTAIYLLGLVSVVVGVLLIMSHPDNFFAYVVLQCSGFALFLCAYFIALRDAKLKEEQKENRLKRLENEIELLKKRAA